MPDNNASISGIEFEIRCSANAASKSLDKFADSLGKVRSADPNSAASGVSSLADALGRLKAAVSGATASKLNKISEAIKGLGGSGAASAANNLESITASIRATQTASGNNAFGRVAKDAETIAVGANNAAQGTRSFSESAKEASENTQKLGNSISNAQQAASEASIKNLGDNIVDASKQTGGWRVKLGKLLSFLKRIAMYRLIRTALKEIAAAIKEGLDNAYEFSKATGGKLAQSLDRIASAGAQMKNQLGAAFGELLVALEPIIVFLAKIITMLAEALTLIISIFSGEFLKANEVSQAWGDADKKAKEYKRTLIGIDEINRLNDDNSGNAASSFSSFEITPLTQEDVKKLIAPLDSGFKNAFQTEIVPVLEDAMEKMPEPKIIPQVETGPAIISLQQLGDAINALPVPDPVLALEPVPVPTIQSVFSLQTALAGVREVLIPLLEEFPVLLTFRVESPVPVLLSILSAIYSVVSSLAQYFPYTLAFAIASPVPALALIVSSIIAQTTLLTAAFDTIPQKIAIAFSSAARYVEEFSREYSEFKTSLEEYNRAIDANIDRYIQNAYNTIKTFFAETKATANEWAPDFIALIASAFVGIARKSNIGLDSIREQISKFLKDGFSSFETWGQEISEMFNGLWNSIQSFMSGVKSAFDSLRESTAWKLIFGESKQTQFPSSTHIPAIPIYPKPIPAFANGGFPDNGELYIAREAGPELVGSIGNHTAVANNEQIYEGISEGVAYANSGVIGAINQLIAVVQQIDPTVELDGLAVSRGLKKYERQVNREYGQPLAVEVGV